MILTSWDIQDDTLLGYFSGLKMLDCRVQPRHATFGGTPERYAGAGAVWGLVGLDFWVIWVLVVCRFFLQTRRIPGKRTGKNSKM